MPFRFSYQDFWAKQTFKECRADTEHFPKINLVSFLLLASFLRSWCHISMLELFSYFSKQKQAAFMRASIFLFFLFGWLQTSTAQDLYYQRGVYNFTIGNYDMAIEDLTQSLEITPK